MSTPAIPNATASGVPGAAVDADDPISDDMPADPPQFGAGLDAGYIFGSYSGFSGRFRGMLRFPLSPAVFADWNLTLGTRGLSDSSATRDGLRGESTINHGLSLSMGGAVGYEFYEGLILSAGIDFAHQSLETSGLWRVSRGEARDAGEGDLTSVGIPLRFAFNLFRWIEADLTYTPRFFEANPDRRAGRSFTGHEFTLGLTMFWDIYGDDSEAPIEQFEEGPEPISPPAVEPTAPAPAPAVSPPSATPPPAPLAPPPPATVTSPAPVLAPQAPPEPTAAATPRPRARPGANTAPAPTTPPAAAQPSPPSAAPAPSGPPATASAPTREPVRLGRTSYSGRYADYAYDGSIDGNCVVRNPAATVRLLTGRDAARFGSLPNVLPGSARFSGGYLRYVINTGTITPRNLGYAISATSSITPGQIVVSWQNAPLSSQYRVHRGDDLTFFRSNRGTWILTLVPGNDPPVYRVQWSAHTYVEPSSAPGSSAVPNRVISANSRSVTTAIYDAACRMMGEP